MEYIYPTYIPSDKMDRLANKAMKEYEEGKLKSFRTMEELGGLVDEYEEE